MRTFQLALRGYSVASLPRALRFALASRSLRSHTFCASRSQKFWKKKCVSIDSKCSETRKNAKKFFCPFLTRSAKFAKIFEKKKCVSIDSKCSETHRNAKKIVYPFDRLRGLRVAQSASGEAQPYLPHVTRRVPRSAHAKFHADWTKTVGARGIQTNKQTNRQSYFNYIDVCD